jgi:hypothetical protein
VVLFRKVAQILKHQSNLFFVISSLDLDWGSPIHAQRKPSPCLLDPDSLFQFLDLPSMCISSFLLVRTGTRADGGSGSAGTEAATCDYCGTRRRRSTVAPTLPEACHVTALCTAPTGSASATPMPRSAPTATPPGPSSAATEANRYRRPPWYFYSAVGLPYDAAARARSCAAQYYNVLFDLFGMECGVDALTS